MYITLYENTSHKEIEMTDLNKIGKKPLIDPKANDSLSERRMILGPTTNINNFNNVKYKWAVTMWNRMLGCTWFPEKTDMAKDKIQYPTLTDDEQFAYDGTLGYLVFLDSINTYNPGQLGNFITAPEVAVLYGRQAFEECIVPDTEVLEQSKGWIQIQYLQVGDKILSSNDKLEGSFQVVEHITCKDLENRELIAFNGRKFDQVVTPEHRMLFRDRYSKLNEVRYADWFYSDKAKAFSKGDLPLATKSFISDNVETVLKPEIRLKVAIQADAYLNRTEIVFDETLGRETMKNKLQGSDKIRRVSIQIKKDRKQERLESILNEIGISYSKSEPDNKERVTYRFDTPFYTSKIFNDCIDLSEFNRETARAFMYELTYWDGWGRVEETSENETTRGYDTTIKTNADFVMAVAAIAGMSVSCSIDKDPRSETFSDLYRVYFDTDENKAIWSVRGTIKVTKTNYTGKVYCPTVKGGFFFVKRNGKVSITGNCLHSKSYEVMLEEICDSAKKEHIYNFWRENEHLLKRTLNLAEHFDNFFKENTLENFSKAIIAMYLLEGLYFYVGFIYFYLLQSRNLMLGSAAMIRFINRDEINHVLIAANVIKAIRAENPGIVKDEDITRLFDEAVNAEKEWWHYIIGDKILGMNKDSITAYIHYLANKRLNMIGFEARYPESRNPFKKLEELADIEGDGLLKENMFEAARTSYQQMNTLGGLDDF